MKATFTRANHEEALRLLRAGSSYDEVAQKFGVKRDTIYRLAKRRNVDMTRKSGNRGVVTFRLSDIEIEAFDKLAAEHGYKSRSEFCRVLVRGAVGLMEVSGSEKEKLEAIQVEVGRIGNNLNQLMKAVNQKRFEVAQTYLEDIKELKQMQRSLRLQLVDIVDEIRRRSTKLWRASEHANA